MITNDYANSKNIAHDWIRWPCIRVSSAEIPSLCEGFPFGVWYETWIFSTCKHRKIKMTQKTFDTRFQCLAAHKNIVKNLKGLIFESEDKTDDQA